MGGFSKDYVRIMKEYWRIMEGFCKDYVRILEGAGWSIAPRVGYCKRFGFVTILMDYERIIKGLCWDSEGVVEGFSKDYVRIMEEILKDPVTINVGTHFCWFPGLCGIVKGSVLLQYWWIMIGLYEDYNDYWWIMLRFLKDCGRFQQGLC